MIYEWQSTIFITDNYLELEEKDNYVEPDEEKKENHIEYLTERFCCLFFPTEIKSSNRDHSKVGLMKELLSLFCFVQWYL